MKVTMTYTTVTMLTIIEHALYNWLIDSTRNKVEENLEEAQLAKRDVFIVSSSVMLSLVTAKRRKKTPAIDEARFMEAISFTAHARRYGNQASGMENRLLTNSYSLSLTCGSG